MENIIDLHIHSCYSDGEDTPNEIIRKAKQKGIKTLAITDHDTLLGNHNITLRKEEREGIKIVPGIELTAKTSHGRMHILGYDINIDDDKLNNAIEKLRNNSVYSVISLISQLKKDYDITFSTEELQKLLITEKNIGRPDIAKLCIQNGYASCVKNAFDLYLEEAYQKTRTTNKGISYSDCISLIKNAGGIPILAHPKTLEKSKDELQKLVEEMILVGLEGIEVYHSSHTEKETKLYEVLAQKYQLLISGGSDYHGHSVKPDIELGTGKNNNLKIKELSLLNKIKKNLP